ncbi:hypothetical protein MPSEU_000683600 [Mayamaea pseudoterrestris]|nr:hypothetical protein MPSEU_000683600 [Mayamaea pseudoterrestris]
MSANAQQDLFLFTGQSNMVGHSGDFESVERNNNLLLDTIDILTDATITETKRRSLLYDRCFLATSSIPYALKPELMANAQADGLMALHAQSLTQDLTIDLPGAYCSFFEVGGKTVPKQLVQTTGCGGPYGHELLFSHRLKQSNEYYSNNDFHVVKVAKGGTRIDEWIPDGGQYWKNLNTAIQTTEGNWKLIVWHQGENDAVDDSVELTYDMYAERLAQLISTLRAEMFFKSPGSFQCLQEIPVIIVKIHWPDVNAFVDKNRAVRQAQADFCAKDPRARLVDLDGLDEFYHLSAPSLMISGNRIAEAYLDLLETEYSCQTASPSNPSSTNTPKTNFRPDFSKTKAWGQKLSRKLGCGATLTAMHPTLRKYFRSDVKEGLVRSPQDRRQWHKKTKKAYEKVCERVE